MRDRRRRWEVIGPGTVVIGPGTGQRQWWGLFEDLLAYQRDDWAGNIIDSWAQQHPGVIAELHATGAPGNHRARVAWRRAARSPASSSSRPNSWMPCPRCALSQGPVSGRGERSRTAYQVPALRTSQPR